MVADHYLDEWNKKINPPTIPVAPPTQYPVYYTQYPAQQLTQEEVDALRRLLERAKKYDEETGQPDCGLDDKKRKLKELAGLMGIEVEFP
jgi:hypothetical protein